jgi:hypothetical protein
MNPSDTANSKPQPLITILLDKLPLGTSEGSLTKTLEELGLKFKNAKILE